MAEGKVEIGPLKFCQWGEGWWCKWNWTDQVILRKEVEVGEERLKRRSLVGKLNENDNLPYCGEYLLVILDSAALLL